MSNVISKVWCAPPLVRVGTIALTVITIAVSSAFLFGCSSDSGSSSAKSNSSGINVVAVEDPPVVLEGGSLKCDAAAPVSTAAFLRVEEPNSIPGINVSREEAKLAVAESELRPNAGNNLKRLSAIVTAQTPSGDLALDEDGLGFKAHLLLLFFERQSIGTM